jgi:hypothetical protein
MANTKYQRQVNDEIVEFEGKVYCVKTSWASGCQGKTFLAKAVEEGVESMDDGMYPTVDVEAFKLEDGSWDVIGICGPELTDETGGGFGTAFWNEKCGFVVIP